MTHRKKGIWTAVVASTIGAIALVTFLTVGLFYIKQNRDENMLKLESYYQSSFYELSEGVSSIESNLCKMMVSASDENSAALAEENYRNAISALNGLSKLPMDREDIKSTSKFLNQVGDWSNSLSKAVRSGKDISSYREQIEEIYIYTAQLNSRINDMIALIKDDYLVINNVGKATLTDFDYNERSVEPSAEYPEIIYDGPYSDGEKQSFAELSTLPEISEDRAKEILKEKFDDISDIESCGYGENPKCYMFTAKKGESNAFACVSVCGGKILSVNTDRVVVVANFMQDGVIRLAKKIATRLGYDGLTEVWYNEVDGIATVNLVYEIDGVICYADLVKVKVGLDGAFIGFEATGYCRSHTDRDVTPTISAAAAAKQISNRLQITNIRLAFVPKDEQEVLCYEVAATYKGLRYFVYVDAHDGSEVDVLRVTEQAGQGQMVS